MKSKKLKAASYSIYVNAVLIAMKAADAVLTASVVIFAELFNSLLDIVASVLAYVGVKKAAEPADADHHYGHEKFENMSALMQTILMIATSMFIIYEASV